MLLSVDILIFPRVSNHLIVISDVFENFRVQTCAATFHVEKTTAPIKIEPPLVLSYRHADVLGREDEDMLALFPDTQRRRLPFRGRGTLMAEK